MQPLQNNLGNNTGWFRLGVVSATIMTPLVTRWRTLRAAERARTLGEARRAAHLPWTHGSEQTRLPPGDKRAVNTGLWLVGVVMGLVAAGTAAFIVIRRRQQSDAELLELPGAGANGKGTHLVEQARQFLSRPVRAPAASAGSTTAASDAGAAGHGAAEQQMAPDRLPDAKDEATAEIVEPGTAPFVGNTRTMVYHAADDEHLPAEENRVYFATAAQAEEAGFHADRGETPAHKT